jgi:alpha/beta hydrolase family protein
MPIRLAVLNRSAALNNRAALDNKALLNKFATSNFYLHFISVAILLTISLSGCIALETPAARRLAADQLAARAGWLPLRLDTKNFVLTAFVPAAVDSVAVLTIYIEGDGFAWVTSSMPSADPSPRNPLALRLALRHNDNAAAWLGRPCQFVLAADWGACTVGDWTDRRFSEEVVAASDSAISVLKQRRGAQRLVLIGYSGGGAIAALVAARRSDVQRLVTIAGNLDHREWTRWHRIAPLNGSLNPPDFAAALTTIPQAHWVGGRDTIVDRRLAESFAAHFPAQFRPAIFQLPDADHSNGWIEHWPALLNQNP